jgi:endonuclease III-like uncharacterized protein
MIDDNYFNRLYTELMTEQMSLMNEIRNDTGDTKSQRRQVAIITAILNQLGKWRDIKKKADE